MLMGIVTKNTIMLVDFVGAGGELRTPIAIAVIGGLLASTLLSLCSFPRSTRSRTMPLRLSAHCSLPAVRPNSPDGSRAGTRRGYNIIPSQTRIDRVWIAAE